MSNPSLLHLKKMRGRVIQRIIVLVLLIILQVAVFVIMFQFFRTKFAYFTVICTVLSLIATLYIVRHDSIPEYKIAWLIPILLLPIFGGLFYLIYGRNHLTPEEQQRYALVMQRSQEALSIQPHAENTQKALQELAGQDADAFLQAQYLHSTAHTSLCSNTQTQYFPLGEEMYPQMLRDLEAAEKFIFLEYFIIEGGQMWDGILEILLRKAQAGVDVRVMYDDFGCMFLLPGEYPRILEEQGIKCCVFNRFSHIFSARFNNRDHRKLCIIDGNIAYTGGINLADRYINLVHPYGQWKDNAVRLEGDAVWNTTVMFLSLWCSVRGEDEDFLPYRPTCQVKGDGLVLPFDDIPLDDDPVGASAYIQMLNRAKRYVYITTPYLIIDNEMIGALRRAAQSGLDVRIITPGIPDKKIVYLLTRSYYEVLLRAGVKIYEYSPGFLHAKTFVCDDSTAIIGTINLDYRSLYLHHECAVWLYDSSAVADARDDFLAMQEKCRMVTLENCHHQSLLKRTFISILRVFSPLI